MPATIELPQFVLSAQIGAVYPDERLSFEVSEPGGKRDWIEKFINRAHEQMEIQRWIKR